MRLTKERMGMSIQCQISSGEMEMEKEMGNIPHSANPSSPSSRFLID